MSYTYVLWREACLVPFSLENTRNTCTLPSLAPRLRVEPHFTISHAQGSSDKAEEQGILTLHFLTGWRSPVQVLFL